MLLRCTAKFAALLRPAELTSAPAGPGDWYANLLWLERRKCVLLTHAETLFPIFVPDVRAGDLRPLGPWLTTVITDQLSAEQLPLGILGELDPGLVEIGKTASRQVLGVMNDLAFHIELLTGDAGGLAGCDLDRLNHDLRRTLYQRDGHYATALDRVAERLHTPPAHGSSRHTTASVEGPPARTPNKQAETTPRGEGEKRSWVDGRVDVLLTELSELGMSASRAAAADLIRERVQWLSSTMGTPAATVRRYLNDKALVDLAREMAFAVAEEAPGADLLDAPRTSAVPLPVLGRCIAGLAEAIHVRLAERDDVEHLRVSVTQLAHALSTLGQLAAQPPRGTATASHIAGQPMVLLPPALVHRAARYLEAAAALLRDGVLPDDLSPEHAARLADTFIADAAALRACAGV